MTEEEFIKVNPNTDDEETLQQLPGIGKSLAQKIIGARPFSALEDLREIRGLGKVALERLEPYLSFADPLGIKNAELDQEDQQDEIKLESGGLEELGESVLSPDGKKEMVLSTSELPLESEKEIQPEFDESHGRGEEKKKPAAPTQRSAPRRTFSRNETLWLMAASGLGSLLLSVLVTLMVIGGINGTLDFNQLQAVNQLESEMIEVQGGLETLSSSVSVLEERLAPLEGLTGRVTTVEDTVGSIQGDVADAMDGVESMQSDIVALSDETARLTGRVDRFDNFLEGMRRIILEVFADPPEESLQIE